MVTNDGLLRIFWPLDAPRDLASGVLVGWRNSDRDLFVVSVLQEVEVGALFSWRAYGPNQASLVTSKMPYW